ncbi:hypothetical protein ACQP2P_40715 [Dactylosporangium sp. CA-139114]|uniref:hypothetical protein n=1 Tax=Dactylosporangium sp. CA-139114 TaxID=3239931 RepID=UPI003D956EAA
MTTSNGFAQQAPLYVRALRLRHLHVGGFVSFLLFECMIAAGVLLALAELVSWWAVPVLPAVVAIMVKVNDMVIGGSRRARALAREAERGSPDRASSTRVDPDDRIGEPASVPRRTTTALDRAEIARAGRTAARSGSDASAARSGASAGRSDASAARAGAEASAAPATAPAVRTRTVEPPAQRKKVGVIKISVPPKDAGSRHAADDDGNREVLDAGYGISPASDDAAVPVVEAPASYAPEPAYASEVPASHALEAAGEEWTDTDSHGFQRSRPLHPSEWSDRPAQDRRGDQPVQNRWRDQPAQDPWAEQAAASVAEPVRDPAPMDWPTETDAWGDRAAWTAPAVSSAQAQANWGDETAWGDRAAWEAGEYGRGAQYSAAAGAGEWDDETGFADQAAWGTPTRSPYGSGSLYGSGSSWGAWEPGAPDYVSDYTGESTGPQQAARDLAARGEAYRSGESTGGHRRHDEEQNHGHDTRPLHRETPGRHARPQTPPPGRRRSDETDNVTSGHFGSGRHADRGWRSDDELARQRTGGVNQGRFA